MDYIFLVAASASVAVNGGSRDCGRDFVAMRRVGILAPFECNVSAYCWSGRPESDLACQRRFIEIMTIADSFDINIAASFFFP